MEQHRDSLGRTMTGWYRTGLKAARSLLGRDAAVVAADEERPGDLPRGVIVVMGGPQEAGREMVRLMLQDSCEMERREAR